jgi:HlyD family secretion protein
MTTAVPRRRTWTLAIVGIPWMLGCSEATSAPAAQTQTAPATAPAVQTEAAVAVQDPVTVELPVQLQAERSVVVAPLAMGRAEAVLVERGSHVEAGDVLVRLRDVDPRRQVAAAEAAYASARARLGGSSELSTIPEVRAAESNLTTAADALRRAEALTQVGSVSAQDLARLRDARDAAQAQRDAARAGARASLAQAEQARVTVEQARQGLTDVTVRAPFAGEVVERTVEVGGLVTPDRGVLSLASTGRLRAVMWVSPSEIDRLRVGSNLSVWIDPEGNARRNAQVSLIGSAIDPDQHAVRVEAWVDNPSGNGHIRPGLRATARLDTGAREARVSIPRNALFERAGVWRAFVVRGDHFEERVVSTTDRFNGRATVERGVTAGEMVAVSPPDTLRDGMLVRR